MLTASTVFTSLITLHAFLASIGQVDATVMRRDDGGHGARHSHKIRGLLNVAGRDESFVKRQTGVCDSGFFPCSDGTGCCQVGTTCDNLPDGTPTCCCTTGGNCQAGYLPCSGNTSVCCPKGDICTSTGGCIPAGSGGGTGGGSGGSGSSGGSGGSGSSGGSGGSGGTGGSGGLGATTSTVKSPGTTFTSLSSVPSFTGGLGGGLSSSPNPAVVTVTPTSTGTGNSLGGKSGAAGLKAAPAVVMIGSVMVASGLAILVL